jgi:hypothetical protein
VCHLYGLEYAGAALVCPQPVQTWPGRFIPVAGDGAIMADIHRAGFSLSRLGTGGQVSLTRRHLQEQDRANRGRGCERANWRDQGPFPGIEWLSLHQHGLQIGL